jgi:uncharacterized protein (TIRG00374 family)
VAQIVSVILAELLIFYAAMEALLLLLLAGSLFFRSDPPVFKITLTAGFVVYLFFGLLIALAGRKQFLNKLWMRMEKIRLVQKVFKNLIHKIQQQGISGNEVQLFPLLNNNRRTILKTFFLQLMVAVSDAFTLFALFYGLGIHTSGFVVLLSLISTRVIALLPFLPGSLILYESSMSFFFVSLGIPLGSAIVVTLLYRLLSFWFPMPIGLFLYRRWSKMAAPVDTLPDLNRQERV